MKEHSVEKIDVYVAPAIERRESVTGLLQQLNGSYTPPGKFS